MRSVYCKQNMHNSCFALYYDPIMGYHCSCSCHIRMNTDKNFKGALKV